MFLRDWMTDDLSNLSRTEMVHTTSSKECGSTLMMAITASSFAGTTHGIEFHKCSGRKMMFCQCEVG
jgi:hypothetical protein